MENRDFSVVIPYMVNGAIWNELRYTLRSIDKNFDFNYDVTIYSDKPIDWIKNVTVKIIDRWYPPMLAEKKFGGKKHYENYYDVLHKLKTLSLDNDLSNEVLYVYDDVLLLKKQDKDQIKTIYAGGTYDKEKTYWENPRNKWTRTVFQAIRKVKGYGKVFLYETHLPRYFQRDKMRELFKLFPIDNMDIPYSPATLYYNYFYDRPDVMYRDEDVDGQLNNPIKAGFYGLPNFLCDSFPSRTAQQVKEFADDKLWINYNNNGLSEPLKEWIQKQFPKKSKFEK